MTPSAPKKFVSNSARREAERNVSAEAAARAGDGGRALRLFNDAHLPVPHLLSLRTRAAGRYALTLLA
jgi:hypothetical protein